MQKSKMYYQEIPQLQTADQPTALWEKEAKEY